MNAPDRWLDRLLGWAVGATSGERADRAGPSHTASTIPGREDMSGEHERHDRSEREREIELRILMSTWM